MFLPFTNLTNRETTYSGGRHLDLRIPEGDFIYLNSNKPLDFLVPIVPTQNYWEIAIKAGV
ncbi:DUF1684 domain-containing protein [uncultured Salegentibacter sp.]|uniref:DUF1684 domain-containing protein n=1 Tax=uncultured Salegentibacter sp. TaxID=259320 RepID=UPI00338FB09C